jgi:hypothetical protein
MTIKELIYQLNIIAKEHGSHLEVKLHSTAVAMSSLIGTTRDHDTPEIRVDVSHLTGKEEVLLDIKQSFKENMH